MTTTATNTSLEWIAHRPTTITNPKSFSSSSLNLSATNTSISTTSGSTSPAVSSSSATSGGEMLTRAFDFVRSVAPSISTFKTSNNKEIEFSEHDFSELSPLIDFNDRLHRELQQEFKIEEQKEFELIPPRVIVAGLTSAGKSSLLEHVIGHRIFPIKDTVCTRRPFVVHMQHDPHADQTTLQFTNPPIQGLVVQETKQGGENKHAADALRSLSLSSPSTSSLSSSVLCSAERPASIAASYILPEQLDRVRLEIERRQQSDRDDVQFSGDEIHADVASKSNETFTFTDLPGIFLVSERKMGQDYAKSRMANESLKETTMQMTRKYLGLPNTIVLVVISSTDWIHGMNNDSLIAHLAEWLEQVRQTQHREVPVYGVITKLDTQEHLSANSPIKKILTNTLDRDHILNGLRVRKWIPVVSSPAVLNEPDKGKAHHMELEALHKLLKNVIPTGEYTKMPIGRAGLLKQLKGALLQAIGESHIRIFDKMKQVNRDLDLALHRLPQVLTVPEKKRLFDSRLDKMETMLYEMIHGNNHESAVGFDASGSGGGGASSSSGSNSSSIIPPPLRRNTRLRLMVEAPSEFEQELNAISLRADSIQEIKHIIDQATLEQGGGFDSDVSFNLLSRKIVERFSQPCSHLIEKCSTIISDALKECVKRAFGDFPKLEIMLLEQIFEQYPSSSSSSSSLKTSQTRVTLPLFQILRQSAISRVLAHLDAYKGMICFHPLWRNFESLYHSFENMSSPYVTSTKPSDLGDRQVNQFGLGPLPTTATTSRTSSVMRNPSSSSSSSPTPSTLEEIMELPALAKRARTEGDIAMETFESKTGTKIGPANRLRISKHFARIEVMGHIIRQSLLCSIYPMTIRDLRDGLFKGLFTPRPFASSFSSTSTVSSFVSSSSFLATIPISAELDFENSLTTMLRSKLIFDPSNEKLVLDYLDPSPEDSNMRSHLMKRKTMICNLQNDYAKCQNKLQRLFEIMNSGTTAIKD